MNLRPAIERHLDDLIRIRRDIHQHPEIGFEEERTSALVAEELTRLGLEVHTGIGQTGVVGVLRGEGQSNRAIGLRADMDALSMDEKTGLPYASANKGAMHACGHDGHTTMLLGAARALAETRDFDGTVVFIFQPAEEGLGGADAMVKDGLFERFTMESVYGIHNMPGLPVGKFAMRTGPCMANADLLKISVKGKGAHGAMPSVGIDPIVVASQIVMAAQSIVARNVDPLKSGVVSITTFHAGSADNVIPDMAELTGTVRTYDTEVQDLIESNLRRVVEGTAAALGAEATIHYQRNYPATVNTVDETAFAADIARRIVGDGNVEDDALPKMGAEDFSFMLNEKPGCYLWLGNGDYGEKGGVNVHNPEYDFNDDIIPYGVSFWVELVENALPKPR